MKKFYQQSLLKVVALLMLLVQLPNAVFAGKNAAVFKELSQVAPCSPVSTLDCSDINVALPYTLDFSTAVANTIVDDNGAGTGFTTVNTFSGTRLAVDGQPTVATVPGYDASKITLTGGRLQLVAAKGIDYLTNNNQINVLGVPVASKGKVQIDTKVINPYYGGQSQQVGLWYGLNDKTFIKLTIAGNKVELRREINDVSSNTTGTSNPDQRITPLINGLNNQTVTLRILIDSVTNSAEGFYALDGENFTNVGASYPSTTLSLGSTDLTTGSVYAGIYASYRNGSSPITYTFDDFGITSLAVAPAPTTANINFQPSSSAVPAGYTADTGLPYSEARQFGWVHPTTKAPLDLTANMRARTGSGDARQLTIVQMQANTNGQVPGTWEYAIANGTYRVTVSAGDNGYYDSNHQVNVEGLPAIADFVGTASTKFRTSTAVVTVSDGKLTVDASGGTNTKLNYITISPATAITDNTAPTVGARFVGTLKSANTYDDEVQVVLTAADAGGSGLASFQYSINGGAYANYKAPFTLRTPGNHNIRVRATDANGNQTTSDPYNFSIVAQSTSGGYMVLKNMDNFPSNDRLVFSFIQEPWRRLTPDTTPYNANHDRVKLRINNKGTGRLTVSNLTLSNPAAWKIVSVGSDATAAMPVNIAAGSYSEVTVQFIPPNADNRVKIFTDTLKITSTDSISPLKNVILSGIWQKAGESTNEPYAQQLVNAFGFGTVIGYGHNDGNNRGTTRVSNSSEINANYFRRADPSKPITVIQVAAYHGCCSTVESIRYFTKGSSSNPNIFTHNPLDGQSILPRLIGSSTNLAQNTFNHDGIFGFRVGNSSSDRTQNYNGLIGMRVLKALDEAGNVIPNAYFLNCDILGTSFTNYDYQDNIYYVENIRPDSGSVGYSELVAMPTKTINYAPAMTGTTTSYTLTIKNNGQTYPSGGNDPAIQLRSVRIEGQNASEFSIPSFTGSTLAVQATRNLTVRFSPTSAGIKNAVLLINYNSAMAPLRVPLYGIANTNTATVTAVKRIKGGVNVSANYGGVPYENDSQYRKGSIKLDVQTPITTVAATDVDSLYKTYLSAAADLAETRYEIPLANGQYQLRFHFVENYWTAPGSRVFKITAGTQELVNNLDIISEVPYRTAMVKDYTATVTNGTLILKFNPTANRVAVAALEIYRVQNNSLLGNNGIDLISSDPLVQTLLAYPNPGTGSNVNLKLSNFAKQEKGTLVVTDSFGKQWLTQNYSVDDQGAGSLNMNFPTKLPRGIYVINAQTQTGKKVYTKLIVE
ncbi:T9SS type A sorting domain-containing protein [Mucilaginibacter sp. JRF]|uniref:malectin domain-containing carbohydrate-binding protein n=1 Tax=Mucilaginibacter sp. JRF TaxID=2780088 RepID=UPI0018828B4A|nr:malectin domain-containing carbohydrate-binding protein [Mucilaginibacter sp. JRF]MBE9585869.1 T9SS type A sorting domain-containing protein [Mucilaginibacter sp. JRF]